MLRYIPKLAKAVTDRVRDLLLQGYKVTTVDLVKAADQGVQEEGVAEGVKQLLAAGIDHNKRRNYANLNLSDVDENWESRQKLAAARLLQWAR